MASLPNSCLYILICIQSPQHAACFLAHNVNSLQERKEGFRAAHVAKLEKKFNNWYKTSISDLQADSYTSVSSMGNYFDIQWDMSKKKKNHKRMQCQLISSLIKPAAPLGRFCQSEYSRFPDIRLQMSCSHWSVTNPGGAQYCLQDIFAS